MSRIVYEIKIRLQFRTVRLIFFLTSFFSMHFFANVFNGFNDGLIVCPWRITINTPCPMCGTTRSIAALSQGKFIQSMNYNPSGVILISGFFLWACKLSYFESAIIKVKDNYDALSLKKQISFLGLLYISLWGFNIIRISSGTYS